MTVIEPACYRATDDSHTHHGARSIHDTNRELMSARGLRVPVMLGYKCVRVTKANGG